MQDADHIAIPLLDSTYALAQVVQVAGHNIVIALTHHVHRTGDTIDAFAGTDVIAIVPVSCASLPKDHWRVVGYDAVPDLNRSRTNFSREDVVPHDPAVIEAFANAIHGLYPWDGFPDPDFFTKLLRNPEALPTRAKMTADLPKPDTT